MKKRKLWLIIFITLLVANYCAFAMNYGTDAKLVLNYIAVTLISFDLGLYFKEDV